jgi:putative ABC transport system permease protein
MVLMIFISVFAGSYPAIILSRINVVDIFKGRQRIGGKNFFSRAMIVLQFALSLFLIIEAGVIFKQKKFLLNQDLGFEKKDLLAIPVKARQGKKDEGTRLLDLLRSKLEGQKSLLSLSGASGILDKGLSGIVRHRDEEMIIVVTNRIDLDYIPTMNIKIKEGRNFSFDYPSDFSHSIIVNETFVKAFELDNPVGKTLSDFRIGGITEPKVVGVVKDFNYTSLHEEIRPLIMHMDQGKDINYIIAKTAPDKSSEALNVFKKMWAQLRPDTIFDYFFLEEDVRMHYREEERWNSIVGYSSIFAIFIAALGLFGLTAISIVKRFKEIGIRKILGATKVEIVKMINREFLYLILIANLIVWPVAFIVSNKWLQNFAYRTSLTVVEFFLSGLLVILVAVFTMSTLAVKASILDPVVVLRDE